MKEYWKDRFSRAKDFVVLGDSHREDEVRIRGLIIDWEGEDWPDSLLICLVFPGSAEYGATFTG